MSDATIAVRGKQTKQPKTPKCEYSHKWRKIETQPETFICTVCGYVPRVDSEEYKRAESIFYLRSVLKPGDTVYTILNNVSRSGMSRRISCVIGGGKDVNNITWHVAWALGEPTKNRTGYVQDVGIQQGGCGMDMGFNLVYNLAATLFGNRYGYECLGKDARCPSNYHSNHHDTVRCNGIGTGDDWQPCTISSEIRLPDTVVEPKADGEQFEPFTVKGRMAHTVRTPRYGDDGVEEICPTCSGLGRHPNPEGPERWDLVHTDGYALRQRWL